MKKKILFTIFKLSKSDKGKIKNMKKCQFIFFKYISTYF